MSASIGMTTGELDLIIFGSVRNSMKEAEKAGRSVRDQSSFYRRLIYHCAAQAVGAPQSFHLPVAGDTRESVCLQVAIREFTKEIAAQPSLATRSLRIKFYNDLHDQLTFHAKTLEEMLEAQTSEAIA